MNWSQRSQSSPSTSRQATRAWRSNPSFPKLYHLHRLYFFPADPDGLLSIDEAICRELQALMSDEAYRGIRFYSGPADGRLDEATRAALKQFMGWENYDVRVRDDDLIDGEVLADIRRNYAAWWRRPA